MLEEVLRHLNNWFLVPDGINLDTYTIEDGGITLPFLQEGQYFRVVGSVFGDGVYQYPASGLKDETFDGAIWSLSVPQAVVNLAEEIEAWQAKNGEAAAGPYQSESFGGYTYSKAVDAATGGAVSWQAAFRSRLNDWRKL